MSQNSTAGNLVLTADERGLIMPCPHCGQRNRVAYGKLDQPFRCGKCQAELRLPGKAVDIKSEAIFDALISQSVLPVLIDFWAPWCGPCRMTAPELVKVAESSVGKWLVAKVDTESLPSLAIRFQISAIPTMALFKEGKEIARQAGAMFAPAIRQFMEKASSTHGP